MSGVVVPTTMKPMSSGVMPGLRDAPRAPPPSRDPTSPRRDRRCGARGCRCAAGSTRRSCRPSSRGRRWSARAAARRSPGPRSRRAATRAARLRTRRARHHSRNPFPGAVEPEVLVGARRRHAAARRAVEEADLDQERLVDVLDRVVLLADAPRRGCSTPTGPPPNFSMIVRSSRRSISSKPCSSTSSSFSAACATSQRDRAVGAHLREVAHAAQQPVRDARRAARPPRDLRRPRRRRSARRGSAPSGARSPRCRASV